jgi:RHS repeat-associated protein
MKLESTHTKHYYIGSQRVSSALGTTFRLGFFPNQANNFFSDLTAMEDFRDVANAKVHTATAALSATYSAMNQSIALLNPAVEGSLDLNTLPFENNLYDAYFYHSDHLGSSNYISNNTGIVSQHTEYLPFGETFVDEHLNSHNTPFKFNAKELDDETGNYYYGARYYNPKWSTWLSVDPLAEKYPEISPYAYCANNPIIYIDPDGRDFDKPEEAQKLINNLENKKTELSANILKWKNEKESSDVKGKRLKTLEKNISNANKRIENLNKSIEDINCLANDGEHIYHFNNIEGIGARHGIRKGEGKNIYIDTSSDAISVHEITHIRQALDADNFNFNNKNMLLNPGNGIRSISFNEVEAYQRQYSVDGSFPGNLYDKGIDGITLHSVGNIYDNKTNSFVYPQIKQYSDNVKKQEKSLKKNGN